MPLPTAAWTLAAGLMLVVAGFAAAFTTAGAVLVLVGLGCVLAGILALVRLPVWFAAGAGAAAALVFIARLAINGP